jgi:hypothetical protein
MKNVKILSRYELAIFSALAGLMVTLTLVLLNIGFQTPIMA